MNRRNFFIFILLLFALPFQSSEAGINFGVVGGGTPAEGGGTEIIGYETIGETTSDGLSGVTCTAMDSPSQNGVIDTIWFYSVNEVATQDYAFGIYADNGSSQPGSKIGTETTFLNQATWTAQWKDFAVNYEVSAGTNYFLCYEANTVYGVTIYYNILGGTNRFTMTHTWGEAWPSSFTINSSSGGKHSLKAQVTY